MTRTAKLVSVCSVCALGLASLVAIAQPEKKSSQPYTKDAKSTQPAQPPAAPAGSEDMAAMMAAWEKAMTPGKHHEWLTQAVGTWDGKVTMWMDPAAPPSHSTCTSVITSTMGGRFTRCETKGQFDMGMGQPMAFEGFGLYGYNNTSEKFESTWCDNLGTMMLRFEGDLSADQKTLTLNANYHCPMKDGPSWMREVETRTSPTTMKLEMFGPTPDGKGEFKMMQIEYTKK